jgi:glycosyltransferase involved in cell wall biosynthesis
VQSGYALAKAMLSSSRGLRQLGPGALYLNIGHLGFTLPGSASWLRKRTDVQSIAFVHDLLSLDHPEFFRPENRRYFARFMRHGVLDAAALLVATDVVRTRVVDCLASSGSGSRPIFVGHLPTRFAPSPALHDPILSRVSYFVMVGTIEPRKNHLLMLNIWRDLCERGEPCPYLVVAGADGWGAAHVHDMLERSKFIRSRIVRVRNLSSGALAHLMANACGVLVPSLAEGYSLPLVEALTLQVPTVASDIAVLREVSQGAALHLDPLDGLAWKAAIQHLADRSSPTASRLRLQASRYTSPAREPYFQSLFDFLQALAPSRPSRTAHDAVS